MASRVPEHDLAHRSPRAALRSPVFWAALLLLLVNDHILKHAGVLPGWITGKLSDFAGMIVAPAWLVAVLDLRSRGARALAFGAVAFVFSLLELSPGAAAAWDAALGALGIRSRSWPDATDLVALAMLPLAWSVVTASERRSFGAGGTALQRGGAALGLLACMATTNPGPVVQDWQTGAWIHNRTSETIDVRLRWAEASLDCGALVSADLDLSAAAAPGLFGPGITMRLAPGETVPIEPDDAMQALGRPGTGMRNPCDLVRVSVDGLGEHLVFFAMPDEHSVPLRFEGEPPEGSDLALGVAILADGDRLAIEAPASRYRIAPLAESAPTLPAECTASRGAALAFDDLSDARGSEWIVRSRTTLPDGCTVLELGQDAVVETRTMHLCVPEDFVPFVANDRIVVSPRTGPDIAVLERADGARTMVAATGLERLMLAEVTVEAGDPVLGCGERIACGSFAVPMSARIGAEAIGAGEVRTFTAPDGSAGRLTLVRAEHVLIANADCDAGRSEIGPRLDIVIVLETTEGL